MKKILSVVLVAVAILFSFTACTGSGEVNYEYRGFVTEVYENAKGENVVVCISDDVESEFIINSNTKIIAPANVPVAVGDYVMLTTMRRNDEIVEKIQVSPGYSTTGRLIYVDGEESPFVLTEPQEDGSRLLVRLVDYRGTLPGISGIGDVIKVFHSSQIVLTEPTANVEALIFIENGTAADLTAEDIAFIELQGYILKSE
ncbi:MAG: hypothetical protein J6S71_10555 [Clostridia bacterium]|nr:hypothetical protein [Clostridia bacterium]